MIEGTALQGERVRQLTAVDTMWLGAWTPYLTVIVSKVMFHPARSTTGELVEPFGSSAVNVRDSPGTNSNPVI